MKEFTIKKMFEEPREVVFKAWTDPNIVALWWGPDEYVCPVCEVDARSGGAINIHMQGPDGTVFPLKGEFHEVVEPEKLVFTSGAFLDEQGEPQVVEFTVVTFSEVNMQTLVTLHSKVIKCPPELSSVLAFMEEGWAQSLDRLGRKIQHT